MQIPYLDSPVHNTVNLYLKRHDKHGGYYFTLHSKRTNLADPEDIPLIHDIAVEDNLEKLYPARYFVIPRLPQTPKWLKNIESHSACLKISTGKIYQTENIVSEFYKKQPDFELCSPGFTNYKTCEKWWHKYSTRHKLCLGKNHWENYIILITP